MAVPATSNPWEAIVGQGGIPLATGSVYTLSFDAWASAPANIQAIVQLDGPPFTGYFNTPVALTTSRQHFSYTFTSPVTDPAAVLQFQLGANAAYTFHLDDVSLTTPAEPAPQPPPARPGRAAPERVLQQRPGGAVVDDVVDLRRRRQRASRGDPHRWWRQSLGRDRRPERRPVFGTGQYTLRLKAWATQNATVNAILQKDGAPFTQYYSAPLALTTTPRSFVLTFTSAAEDLDAVLQFQMGGQGNFTVYLDNVSLLGPIPNSMFPSTELVANGGFSEGRDPWWTSRATSFSTPRAARCRRPSSAPARTRGTRSSARTTSRSSRACRTR